MSDNYGKGYWIDRFIPRGAIVATAPQGPTAPGGKAQKYDLTAQVADGNNVFTIPVTPDVNVLQVFKNGTLQADSDYNVVGSTLTVTGFTLSSTKQDVLVVVC
jgi:hypothetical protein